jgi:hypothetical protein
MGHIASLLLTFGLIIFFVKQVVLIYPMILQQNQHHMGNHSSVQKQNDLPQQHRMQQQNYKKQQHYKQQRQTLLKIQPMHAKNILEKRAPPLGEKKENPMKRALQYKNWQKLGQLLNKTEHAESKSFIERLSKEECSKIRPYLHVQKKNMLPLKDQQKILDTKAAKENSNAEKVKQKNTDPEKHLRPRWSEVLQKWEIK